VKRKVKNKPVWGTKFILWIFSLLRNTNTLLEKVY